MIVFDGSVDVSCMDRDSMVGCVCGWLYGFQVSSELGTCKVLMVHEMKFNRAELLEIWNKVLDVLKDDKDFPVIQKEDLVGVLRKFGFSSMMWGIASCNVPVVIDNDDEVVEEVKTDTSSVQTTLF